jgi:hypothetical protein
VFALTASAAPAVSTLLLQRQDAQFCLMAWLLCAGWAVNTRSVPAYFCNMGSGRLRWNTIGHVLIGLLNALLASVLGVLAGWWGVVIGSTLALAAGSLVILVAFHRERGIAMAELVPGESRLLLIFGIGATAVIGFAAVKLLSPDSGLEVAFLPVVAITLVLAPFALMHPMRRTLQALVMRGMRGK